MPDVVVTGASRGIGRGVALRLAEAGQEVVAWARSAEDLASLAQEAGGRIETACVDVRDPDAVNAAAAALYGDGVPVRAVVVNAGMGVWNTVPELDPADWRRMIDTNLSGAFYTLAALGPMVQEHPGGGGQVIAMLSDSSWFAYPQRAGYCASKAGLEGLIESFRREVRPAGVRVTSIYPSRVDTHFRDREPGLRPEALQTSDIAELVQFLLGLPPHVEIRSLAVSSLTSSYGPFPEVGPLAEAPAGR